MNPFWSPLVATLEPYVPGEQPRQPGIVKLNTNESPHGPSPMAIEAMRDAAGADLRLYPDPDSSDLRSAIAGFHGVESYNVFPGNGSDEVLAHAFRALLDHRSPVLFPDISYSFYPVYCRLFGIPFQRVPLSKTFDIELDDYHRENGGIIFPNPNAPTGKALPLERIQRLIRANTDSVVVIDEAYVDFGAQTATRLIREFPNLLVVQTLSKSRALAGLRVGFAIGDRGLIEALERVKNSFNSYPLSRLAQAGAAASVRDVAHFENTCRLVIDSREWLTGRLADLGFEVLPSAANFVLARHADHPGAELAAALRQRAILVRHFDTPRIEEFVRITIGSDEQCRLLVDALCEIVNLT